MYKNSTYLMLICIVLTGCGGSLNGDDNENSSLANSSSAALDDETTTPAVTDNNSADSNGTSTAPLPGACIDTGVINDGWGWDGVAPCPLPINVQQPTTQPDPIAQPNPATGTTSTVSSATYNCETINGNNQHSFTLFADHSGNLDWFITGDSVWAVTQGTRPQPYGVTEFGLQGRNPQFDRGADYIQNCTLQAGQNHQWLLDTLPDTQFNQPTDQISDQVTYNCSLDTDPTTNWTWILRTDNRIYDPAGEQTGRWSWFGDGQTIQINPDGNPSPQNRWAENGKDLILYDSRGGDYGTCIADKQLPRSPIVGFFDYSMFHCNINDDRHYVLFSPNGLLLSQYGQDLGSWTYAGDNVYEFRGHQWTATDQGTLIGESNDRGSLFCSQHTGRALFNL